MQVVSSDEPIGTSASSRLTKSALARYWQPAGLMTLGADERSVGGVWHLPGPETVTTTALMQMVASEVGHPVGIRLMPRIVLRALGLVNPMMRGLAEMRYQFDEPFVLDTSKFVSTFGAATTPLSTAVADTVAWFRARTTHP